MSRFLGRVEAQALCGKVLGWSKADECRVTYSGSWSGNTRFARNEMSTSGSVEDGTTVVQSAFGKRVASATTNTFTDESLRGAVERSERLAKLAPEDPEYLPELEPQRYLGVDAYFEGTANLSPEERARAAGLAIEQCRAAGDLVAAGFIQAGAGAQAIANSRELFCYHQSTDANFTLTVRTRDGTGSGWAGAGHPDWRRVAPAEIVRRAAEKAAASRQPVAIEPGRYPVVMEPQAVGDLVQLLGFSADARSADEGRSAFTKEGGGNRIGEKIVDLRVELFSDPGDADLLSAPFDGTGLPLGREVWIKDGLLQNLIYSRFWGQKQGKRVTGFPNSLKMAGGGNSIEQLVSGTARGVLVTRLWYLREVDPRAVLYTGLTRDGTFLIEDGKVSKAIKNFRFNDSPLFLLNHLDALGGEERLGGTEAGGAVVMPALRATDFSFTSLSDAV